MKNEIIYLDHAASSPMPDDVIDAMSVCLHQYYGNPSATHTAGRKARVLLEESRRKVASLLGAKPSEIVFTSGGTEANNAILWGIYYGLDRDTYISSRLEHPAVLQTLSALERHCRAKVLFVNTDNKGHVDLNHLEELLRDNPRSVVSLMHANNEIGNLLPVKAVSDLCRSHDGLFHSDTVQTIGKFHIDLASSVFDFVVGSAHKFHGPKGVGFMFIRDGFLLDALIRGGSQERMLRAGTENLCGIVGMAKALEWQLSGLEATQKYIASLKAILMDRLQSMFPTAIFNGDPQGRSIYSLLNVTLPLQMAGNMLLAHLDMLGICVSAGSACASGSVGGSHVMKELGIDDTAPTIRVSFGKTTTPQQIDLLLDALKSLT